MERPSWNAYFMEMAHLAKSRSTCLRRQVGAVLVKGRQVIATGYNGSPTGQKHCSDIGCLRDELNVPSGERDELCRAVHAEQNLIAQASKRGISSEGATVYCTTFPCFICAKLLINSGISEIYYEEYYNAPQTKEMFEEANIELVHWQGESNE